MVLLPQSGALSWSGVRVTGLRPVPSVRSVKTSAASATPVIPNAIDVPSGENDEE